MNAVVKGSIALAGAVALVSILMAVTGMHKNPILGGIVSLVVVIGLDIVAVWWVLKQTAADNGYGKQLLNGLLVGVVAGVLIFLFSWVMLTVLFPNYMDEANDAMIEWMESSGMPQEQVEAQIERAENATPLRQSMAGLIGTFFTSLIAGAIVAIFVRKK